MCQRSRHPEQTHESSGIFLAFSITAEFHVYVHVDFLVLFLIDAEGKRLRHSHQCSAAFSQHNMMTPASLQPQPDPRPSNRHDLRRTGLHDTTQRLSDCSLRSSWSRSTLRNRQINSVLYVVTQLQWSGECINKYRHKRYMTEKDA